MINNHDISCLCCQFTSSVWPKPAVRRTNAIFCFAHNYKLTVTGNKPINVWVASFSAPPLLSTRGNHGNTVYLTWQIFIYHFLFSFKCRITSVMQPPWDLCLLPIGSFVCLMLFRLKIAYNLCLNLRLSSKSRCFIIPEHLIIKATGPD